MKLSEATKEVLGQVLHDGEFNCIAFATETEQDKFLTFLEKEKFLSALDNPHISCVLTTAELAEKVPAHIEGLFVCEQPKASLFWIHNDLATDPAYVGETKKTTVGAGCQISPLAYIDPVNVTIGNRVVIEPFATVKGHVTIGDDVIIRSGAMVGSKGFSFSKAVDGTNMPVIDTAAIEINNGVEIFELVTISTGIFPWEKTVIGENTKIDAQCHVGHGAQIGKNCLLAEGSRCCGNSRVGDNTWVGVGAIVSNRVSVGTNCRVSIGSVATKDVPTGETVTGNFAIPHSIFMRNLKESLRKDEE